MGYTPPSGSVIISSARAIFTPVNSRLKTASSPICISSAIIWPRNVVRSPRLTFELGARSFAEIKDSWPIVSDFSPAKFISKSVACPELACGELVEPVEEGDDVVRADRFHIFYYNTKLAPASGTIASTASSSRIFCASAALASSSPCTTKTFISVSRICFSHSKSCVWSACAE